MHSDTRTYSTTTLLALIIFAGLLLRCFFFSGYVSGDDAAYIAKAFSYSTGDFTPPYSHWGARIAVVLPTALSYALVGVSDVSTVFLPMLLSLGSILVAFLLGRELFDEKTGLLAAVFTAFFPMEVLFASQLFPYTFLSFFTALALLLFIKGTNKSSATLLFMAGIAMGLAYLSRITALYCGLFFILLIVWNRKIDRSYFIFGGGFVCIFLLECLWSLWQTGEPLYRFTGVLFHKASLSPEQLSAAAEAVQHKEWSKPLKWYFEPFVRPIFEQEFGGFFIFLWPIAFYQLIWGKNRQVKLLLLWIIPLFLYISYGSTSPVEYKTLRRLPRYLSFIIVPSMVLIAYQVSTLPRFKWKLLAVASLAAMSLLCLLVDNSPYVTEREQKLTRYIERNSDKTFIVPRSLYLDYLYYSKFQPAQNVLHYYRDNDRSDSLKRIRLVQPDSRRASDLELGCGNAYLVDDQGYFGGELREWKKAVVDHTISREDRFYHRLIRNPVVFSVLSLVRDGSRLKLLTSSKTSEYYIYGPSACETSIPIK